VNLCIFTVNVEEILEDQTRFYKFFIVLFKLKVIASYAVGIKYFM